jgi:hypothetical protein
MESVPGAVATGSQLAHDPGSRSRDPVATAPGTDLILKLRHYPPAVAGGFILIRVMSKDQPSVVSWTLPNRPLPQAVLTSRIFSLPCKLQNLKRSEQD